MAAYDTFGHLGCTICEQDALWLHALQVIWRESGRLRRLRQQQPRFPAAIVAQEGAGDRKWLGDDGSVHEGLNFWSILGLG
jgi:hypothetical protein